MDRHLDHFRVYYRLNVGTDAGLCPALGHILILLLLFLPLGLDSPVLKTRDIISWNDYHY